MHTLSILLLSLLALPTWASDDDRLLDDETRTYTQVEFPVQLAQAMADIPGIFAKFQPVGISNAQTSLEEKGPRGLPQFLVEGTVRTGIFPMRTYLKGDLTITPFAECESRLPGYKLTLTFEDSPDWIQGNASSVYGNLCPVLVSPDRVGQHDWRFQTYVVVGPRPQWAVGRKLYNLLAQQAKPLFDAIEARALGKPLEE
jgi:hypothetical protein